MDILFKILMFDALLLFASCNNGNTRHASNDLPEAKDTVDYHKLGEIYDNNIIIKDTIDLENKACVLPDDICLCIKSGQIKNGTLIGHMTKIKNAGACFNRVRILGSWNVPIITSSMFCDLNYDNSLRDVLALSNSSISNKIIIEEGVYKVACSEEDATCLTVHANTYLEINGKIKLTPNNLRGYSILKIRGDNITVKGKGVIIGDKHTHLGKDGEWGMGIDIGYSHHVFISGLTIKDCWGDCIYVGANSTDILIEKCNLDHGRRQGISITSAKGVVIRDCYISNVEGTAPQHAIDVEPNAGGTADDITIDNVKVENCRGGILAYGRASKANIGRINVKNCVLKGTTKTAFCFKSCATVVVEDCKVVNCQLTNPIIHEDINNGIFKNIKRE